MTTLPSEKPRISNGGSPALLTPAPPIIADLGADHSSSSAINSGEDFLNVLPCVAAPCLAREEGVNAVHVAQSATERKNFIFAIGVIAIVFGVECGKVDTTDLVVVSFLSSSASWSRSAGQQGDDSNTTHRLTRNKGVAAMMRRAITCRFQMSPYSRLNNMLPLIHVVFIPESSRHDVLADLYHL